jgi:hypothetical protein
MKRIFAIGLIGVGFLLTTGAAAWAYVNSRVNQSTDVFLPDSIAGLPITNYTTGAEAVAEFADLHGKQFPVTFGAVGVYGNREITLWVARTASASIALELTNAMQERIADGNSPFTPIDEIKNRSGTIYALEGMGQMHYYFQSQNLVIWLAADPAVADEALQQILEVFS